MISWKEWIIFEHVQQIPWWRCWPSAYGFCSETATKFHWRSRNNRICSQTGAFLLVKYLIPIYYFESLCFEISRFHSQKYISLFSTLSGNVINFLFCWWSQVAPYKKIRRVAFVDSIPKNATGKILRKDLSKIVLQQSYSRL